MTSTQLKRIRSFIHQRDFDRSTGQWPIRPAGYARRARAAGANTTGSRPRPAGRFPSRSRATSRTRRAASRSRRAVASAPPDQAEEPKLSATVAVQTPTHMQAALPRVWYSTAASESERARTNREPTASGACPRLSTIPDGCRLPCPAHQPARPPPRSPPARPTRSRASHHAPRAATYSHDENA